MIGRMNPTINYRLTPASPLRRQLRAVGCSAKYLLASLVALAVIAGFGCGQFFQGVPGSGNVVAEDRAVEGEFDAVELQGPPNVTIKVDAQVERPTVVVTTDDNLLQHVTTTVENGALVIDIEEEISPTKGIKVEITMPRLSAVRLLGSGDVDASGIEAEAFKASVTGSGNVKLMGKAASAELAVTGSGDLRAEGLSVATAKARVTGSGDLSLSASDSADAKVTGSGDIVVHGSPKQLSKSVTGSGDVRTK